MLSPTTDRVFNRHAHPISGRQEQIRIWLGYGHLVARDSPAHRPPARAFSAWARALDPPAGGDRRGPRFPPGRPAVRARRAAAAPAMHTGGRPPRGTAGARSVLRGQVMADFAREHFTINPPLMPIRGGSARPPAAAPHAPGHRARRARAGTRCPPACRPGRTEGGFCCAGIAWSSGMAGSGAPQMRRRWRGCQGRATLAAK